MSLKPFHLAVPVSDLRLARNFYGELLGCPEGRSTDEWIDFDFFGHQFVCHLVATAIKSAATNSVAGKDVPVPHFGVVLDWAEWERLAEHLSAAGTDFILAPGVRFAGLPGEQATMFLADPCGNMLEFKAMQNPGNLFSKQ
jgi:extradiol dioxygenase family protein